MVGITGASGACIATRLLRGLASAQCETHVVISPYGRQLLAEESGITAPTADALVGPELAPRLTLHGYRDLGSTLASGSFLTDALIICPCSGNTLADVASGKGSNLISRAAAVHLKESRRLILVPREMPLSRIEIENMLRVTRAGGIICPASPGFYMAPRSIDDLVDFIVGKLLDLVHVPHDLNTRWKPAPRREPPADED